MFIKLSVYGFRHIARAIPGTASVFAVETDNILMQIALSLWERDISRTAHHKNLSALTVCHTGKRSATEVAQLYVQDCVGSVVRPVKELKRFQRIELAAGETKTVTFELPVSELAFWNIDMEYVVEPGDFRLWVAGDSDSGEPVNFVVK